MLSEKIVELENIIGYKFNDISHLEIALTHKSYIYEKMCGPRISYERYEFLGDAILEYLVSSFLFAEYPDKSEGELTKLRASLVCEFTLSKISRELKLGKYAFFGKGEMNTGGPNRDSILCDMFESVLGAIYLDGGIDEADKFVKKYLLTDIEHKHIFYDSKTRMQEYAQKNNKKIEYRLTGERGPEHNKEFEVDLVLGDNVLANGVGHSRKSAEQMAAYNALNSLK